jgi:hypothetical protein
MWVRIAIKKLARRQETLQEMELNPSSEGPGL